ncbi:MAG: hydrogenase maturation protease [Bryobacterales bacterium]|nr:hydrogenase maturation protease [Bryobacterales bacterium]
MILCCGNPERGDDGAGPAVAHSLQARRIPVTLVDGHAAALLDAWTGAPWVIIVDAVVTGAQPGTVHRWDRLPEFASTPGSTHGLGVREALELGRILGNLPPAVIVIGVEAGSFEPGAPLTESVQAALPAVVEQVINDAGRLLARPRGDAAGRDA